LGRYRRWCRSLTENGQAAVVETAEGFVRGSVVTIDGARLFAIKVSEGPVSGDPRVTSALLRLFAADHVLPAVVRRRGEVTIHLEEAAAFNGNSGLADLIRPLLTRNRVEEPLYEYQREGAAWLLTRDRAILADDMGLGKTAQAIAALRRLVRHGRVGWGLVVTPRTLLANWAAEFERWAPELSVEVLLPEGAQRERVWRSAANRCHITITSYDHLRAAGSAVALTHPDVLVADEAHRLRREESAVSSAFRSIATPRTWLLSGTPVENRAEDLAVLMSILEPDRFSVDDGDLHPVSLRARTRDYILRRRKSEVLKDLPPTIEVDEVIELAPSQRDSYNQQIRAHSALQRPDYLALFNSLRSICDLDPVTGESSKLDRVVEIISSGRDVGEKVVVFSYLLEPLRALSSRLQDERMEHQILEGAMSLDGRERAIESFKVDSDCCALLASMRVASEGLTLTEASTVVFVNRWWNPSANAQARDRVVRIGQRNPVRIFTFTCRGTVEDRLPSILATKAVTFESLVDHIALNATELFGDA